MQRLSNLPDGGVDALFSVEENVLAPYVLDNGFPADYLVPVFHQEDEQLHRDLFQPDNVAIEAKLITSQIKFEHFEIGGYRHLVDHLRGTVHSIPVCSKRDTSRGNSNLRLYLELMKPP